MTSRRYRSPIMTIVPSRVGRLFAGPTLAVTLGLTGLIAPAVVAPTHAAAASAAVHNSCTISRCSAARTARTGWSSLDWPTRSGWYAWPYGQYNYTGGTFG